MMSPARIRCWTNTIASTRGARVFSAIAGAAAGVLLLAGAGCVNQSTFDVTIRGDGTVLVKASLTMERSEVEEFLGEYGALDLDEVDEDEGLDDEADGDDDVSEDEKQDGAEPADEAERIAASIRKYVAEEAPYFNLDLFFDLEIPELTPEEGTFTLDAVEVDEESVRIKVTWLFSDLRSFVAHTETLWEYLFVDRLVLDATDGGKLRVTLSHTEDPNLKDWFYDALNHVTTYRHLGYKASISVTMPGRVTTSTLPTTDGPTTALVIDTEQRGGLPALERFCTEDQVIVAEPGKLDLAQLPLDSDEVFPKAEEEAEATDSEQESGPIVEAGAQYFVQPTEVRATIVRVFPEAEARLGDKLQPFVTRLGSSRCEITAHVSSLKGDTRVREVSWESITRAVDDLGNQLRPLLPSMGGQGGEFTIALELPRPKASAIEEISGILHARISGAGMKTREIDNISADPKTEIDISDVVPDGKLVIGKIEKRADDLGYPEGDVWVTVTSSGDLGEIGFELRAQGYEHERTFSGVDSCEWGEADGQAVYHGKISYRRLSEDQPNPRDDAKDVKLKLIIKNPPAVRYERIKFKMEGIWLL